MNRLRLAAAAMAAIVLAAGGSAPVRAASTQEQIEAVQGEKAQSESALAETQERISSLENQRGDLENYLAELSRQYEELTISLEELSAKAKQKQKELELVKKELKNAREREKEQYESMKKRISYMYEKSKGSFLTTLLSADSFTDFLARAENFMQISRYDREMLKKYELAKEKVQDQKQAVKVEEEAIIQLQEESARKRQEVESMEASTQNEISMYAQEIERSEGEAASLLETVNRQSAQLASLVKKAEAEAEAARKAAEAELLRQQEEEQEAAKAEQAQKEADSSDHRGASVQMDDEEEVLDEIPAEATEGIAAPVPETTVEAEITAAPENTVAAPESTATPASEVPGTSDTASNGSAGTYLGEFTLTAYCNCSICCGSWSGGGTASGTTPTPGRTVAMGGVPFGTKLLINGNVYTVEDRGTGYGHVDIYMNSHSSAIQFGSQRASVYQLN